MWWEKTWLCPWETHGPPQAAGFELKVTTLVGGSYTVHLIVWSDGLTDCARGAIVILPGVVLSVEVECLLSLYA